ncbi:MAG: phosphotransferase [Victivallales bacterium]|jgi:hypothetical protein|nr:phosphotransferase [Victivallales bacterium]
MKHLRRKCSEDDLPPHLRMAEMLSGETDLPAEIATSFADLGAPPIRRATKIKQSFHETFMIEFEAPVTGLGLGPTGDPTRAVVQVLGAQVGDKGLFSLQAPISSQGIVRAHQLAREAGVPVPHTWATGTVSSRGPFKNLPFIVYEYINTDTVEDETCAPGEEWNRIVSNQVQRPLAACVLHDRDTSPLPQIPDVYALLAQLRSMALDTDDGALCASLGRLEDVCSHRYRIAPGPSTLIHQDLNGGNVLCSRDRRGWHLDSVIDWESAVVGDSRLALPTEPWTVVRRFGIVVLVRWLWHKTQSRPQGVPRCNLAELLENHDESEEALMRAGWLEGS